MPRRLPTLIMGLTIALVLFGCTDPTDPADTAGPGPRAATDDEGEQLRRSIVLADNSEPESFNPIAGHGENGSSKIYDGLVGLDAGDGTELPTLVPRLATEFPEPNDDATVWTVRLRSDVTFHDGSAFSADDVVATYEAVIDPTYASPLATSFTMLDEVEKVDDQTVRFHLDHPYAPFDSLLLLGIAPADALEPPAPAEESSLNTEPIGTGPYRLVSLRNDEFQLEAFDDYWNGPPAIETITVAVATDDNTRAQRMTVGEFDGTTLPPRLANTFAEESGIEVVANASADWRGITLPTDHPVTADPTVRMALNLAVDREAMIDHVLDRHGQPASTLVPEVFGEYYAPDAVFEHDPDEARQLLDDAGWVADDGQTRVKDGQRARFTVMYNAADTVRRDFAQAFASDAAQIGIEVELHGTDWNEIEDRLDTDAVVLGGGSRPYDPDTQLYTALHSSYLDPDVGGPYDNVSRYSNDDVDEALDTGRRSTDHDTRVEAYRAVQRTYVADPPMVTLAFLDHTYVMSAGWPEPTPILEPHVHGVSWGPWWNLETWPAE